MTHFFDRFRGAIALLVFGYDIKDKSQQIAAFQRWLYCDAVVHGTVTRDGFVLNRLEQER